MGGELTDTTGLTAYLPIDRRVAEAVEVVPPVDSTEYAKNRQAEICAEFITAGVRI